MCSKTSTSFWIILRFFFRFDSTYNDGVGKESLANHFYTEGYDAKTVKNDKGVVRHSHMTLFTDYILASDEQSPVHFNMDVYDGEELIKHTEFDTEIPVQRNHLTTIIGNVLAMLICIIQKTTHILKLNPENYYVSFVPVNIDLVQILMADALSFVAIMLLLLIPCLFISKVDPAQTVRVR